MGMVKVSYGFDIMSVQNNNKITLSVICALHSLLFVFVSQVTHFSSETPVVLEAIKPHD